MVIYFGISKVLLIKYLSLMMHLVSPFYSVGNESFAVVEFAPFQKVPSEKKKQDPRSGTITEGKRANILSTLYLHDDASDPDYISFIESLTAPTKPLTPEPVVQIENTTTPLLAALLAEKSAAKDSSQRFNGHIHPAMTAAMNRQEREKHRLEEEREFSRNGVPPTSIEPQKQMKDVKILTNSNANQGATSTATPSTPGKKSRKPSSSAPPTSPPKQKNSSSKPVSGDSSAQTKPERKRPVFKFETALAATPMTAANPDSKDDATKPSRRARQREKEKDKNDGPSHVATSSSNTDHPSAAPSPRPPKAKPVQSPPTHHSKKPSAKGHSEEGSIVPTRSPAAGIIAIQMTSHTPAERGGRGGRAPRGRGRGGGGGGGGNGGRGGAPS